MSKAMRALWLLAAGILFVSAQAYAQETVVYRAQPASKLWVEGTSNKSDWTVNATDFSGTVTMNRNVSASDPGVQDVKIEVVAGKLESGRSTIMDRLMHDALQVEAHPTISYELISAEPAGAPAGNGNAFALDTRGRLTLAGTTREIDMAVQGEKLANGQVRFTGSHELLMSEYGITPPSAMFGALRTGDKVKVAFEFVVAPGS